MITESVLKGEKVTLRATELSDCNEAYLAWLNDPEVNQYLETRWSEQTSEKIIEFVKSMRESSHSYLFAIIFEGQHVGNIKIGPIHPIYRTADISYCIGEKSAWGKGIATEAVALVTDFGFNVLNLHKLSARAFSPNIGSQKALTKNGYQREAVDRKNAFIHPGEEYIDGYFYGLLKDEYKK